MATTVTTKGQVTIPKEVRVRLGIWPGDRVDFELAADGRVVITKVGSTPVIDRFQALRGRAGPGLSTDEIMALTRGD